jgi:hypothetical protein
MTTPNRPRPVADLVPTLTKDAFGRKNMLFGKMLAEWEHIAGPDIAAQTTPLELKYSRSGGAKKTGEKADKTPPKAVLVLAVQPAFALELSYQKDLLAERLNVFFGYGAIKDIKIVQHSGVMDNKQTKAPLTRPLTMQEQQKIDGLVGSIQENDLQTALKNLGKAIVSRLGKQP